MGHEFAERNRVYEFIAILETDLISGKESRSYVFGEALSWFLLFNLMGIENRARNFQVITLPRNLIIVGILYRLNEMLYFASDLATLIKDDRGRVKKKQGLV